METYYGEIEQARGRIARERVLTGLKTLTRDTENLLKATANDVSHKTREVRARVAATLRRAKSACAELQQPAIAAAGAVARKTDTAIRAHLYESIGVAFAAGFLIGTLIGRRDRNPRD
jgi:ElaB/YqjD/DUF883 family membrane-anchored ribosome-binding protein